MLWKSIINVFFEREKEKRDFCILADKYAGSQGVFQYRILYSKKK